MSLIHKTSPLFEQKGGEQVLCLRVSRPFLKKKSKSEDIKTFVDKYSASTTKIIHDGPQV